MIVFAAITPHSPLLIPTIGKEQTEKLALTRQAFSELEKALYVSKVDTIVMFSPHAPMYPDAMSALVAEDFHGGLKEFGDHGTTFEMKPDFLTLDRVHSFMRSKQFPFALTDAEELDFGFSVPLLLLTAQTPSVRILPIAMSGLDATRHYEFGQLLKEVLHSETSRVAVIASADLSHHANTNAPQGHTESGEEFDRLIRKAVVKRDAESLLCIPVSLLEKAGQCGYKPILTLFGCLSDMNITPNELCYEAPFGVGYLTVRYTLG